MQEIVSSSEVKKKLLPVMDSMDLLSGKWRIAILTALYVAGELRFNELKAHIPKITGRSLSLDLKFLETHGVVSRRIKDTSPITVEYRLTEYGLTLDHVFIALSEWGIKHRRRILGK